MCMFGLHKSFDAFNRPFDAFDKSFDEFDKSFDAFDKSFDAFDRSFDACNKSFDTFAFDESLHLQMQAKFTQFETVIYIHNTF